LTRSLISLPDNEAEASARTAYAELRDPRTQAAPIIRAELERRGLLPRMQEPVAHQAEEVPKHAT